MVTSGVAIRVSRVSIVVTSWGYDKGFEGFYCGYLWGYDKGFEGFYYDYLLGCYKGFYCYGYFYSNPHSIKDLRPA